MCSQLESGQQGLGVEALPQPERGGASGAPRGGSHQGVIITSGWVSSLGVSGASLSPAYLSPKKTLEDWVPQMSEANTHDSRCLLIDTHHLTTKTLTVATFHR